MSAVDADRQARESVRRNLQAEAGERRRRALLADAAAARILEDMKNFRNHKGERDLGRALIYYLEHFGTAKFESVEARRKAIIAMAHSEMDEALFAFRESALTGRRQNVERLDNVVHELNGEATGDEAAKRIARAFSRVAERLRQRFNAAGGAIAHLDGWIAPQIHNPRALIRAGKTLGEARQNWKDFVRPRLDRERMRSALTGERLSDQELEEALDYIFDQITTEGWANREPQRRTKGRGALASQHADHRFLHFKNAAGWLEYQREFGEGDPFKSMMHYINTMARDIAAMERLGPNPDATFEWMKQLVMREAMTTMGRHQRYWTKRRIARADAMWAHMRGTNNIPVDTLLADTVDTGRNLAASIYLGAASLSSITDTVSGTAARQYSGVTRNVLSGYVSQLSRMSRQEAVRSGLMLESALNVMGREARRAGIQGGRAWSRMLADRTLILSGLEPLTQMGRHSFGMAFFAEVADHAARQFNDLPAAFRETFERYGVSADDWDVIRLADQHIPTPESAGFVRARDVMDMAQNDALVGQVMAARGLTDLDTARNVIREVAEKYNGMVLMETEYAVPTSSVRASATLKGNTQAGTFWGSVARSFSTFKSFPTLVVLLHGGRVFHDLTGGRAGRAAVYGGGIALAGMIVGAAVLQAKDFVKGREPRDMDSKEFWTAAMLQGGGLGIWGDFLFADVNRFGGGVGETMMGPVFGMGTDLWKRTRRNIDRLAAGDETKFTADLLDFGLNHMPVVGSLFYTRLAWERIIKDQAQHLFDPDAEKAWRRQRRRLERDYGQGYWWQPGELSPSF